MGIQITPDELNAVNILGAQAQQIQSQLQQVQAAQLSIINLLELKYDAVFDPTTGKFNPKDKSSEDV